jgi:hypothetical protein
MITIKALFSLNNFHHYMQGSKQRSENNMSNFVGCFFASENFCWLFSKQSLVSYVLEWQ